MMVLYKVCDFGTDPKSKMAATAELSLTLDPMRKHVNCCFLKTVLSIELILCRNDHMMVLDKVFNSGVNLKSKMAATLEHI